MQSANLANQQFLKDYNHMLSHHVDCILKSRLILDEDMHLLLTFWDPSTCAKESNWHRSTQTVTSAMCAAIGLLVSAKLRNLYLLTIAVLPATAQIYRSMKVRYFERKYKRNFERLLSHISEFYKVNCNILEYYHKRDTAMQAYKMPTEAYTILLKPGEEFLKCATLIVITVLEKTKNSMLKICELVPITEGEYIYSVEWNFENFKRLDCHDFKKLQQQFQKLNDLYVLIMSNFLSSLGLSFCVQLWKETSCSFKSIFDTVIPEQTCVLEKSLDEIRTHFNRIRFTLYNTECDSFGKLQEKCKSTNNFLQLQRPLADFLANVQVTFETGKELQLMIDRGDLKVEFENLSPLVEDVSNQLAVCDDSLNTFLKLFSILTKRSISKKTDSRPLTVATNESKVTAEIHCDDPSEFLEDEEYNLFVHGSEEEDFPLPFCEYADQCSTEDLELMLHELKRKLKERKGGQDKTQNKQDKTEVSSGHKTSEFAISKATENHQLAATTNSPVQKRVPPIPPPVPFLCENNIPSFPASPVVVDQLLHVDNSYLGFLDAVKSVAQNLNRDEEVFGSEAIVSCDSDES